MATMARSASHRSGEGEGGGPSWNALPGGRGRPGLAAEDVIGAEWRRPNYPAAEE